MLYRIFIRDLILMASIGVYPKEKKERQQVVISVTLDLKEGGPKNDTLAETVSYDDVVAGIKRLIDQGHINLLETLGERITDLCLMDDRVSKVHVRLEKPDVLGSQGRVGIETQRERASERFNQYRDSGLSGSGDDSVRD